MEYKSSDLNSLKEIAKQLIATFKEDAIVLLDGEMGSGKTTLASEICAQLGVEESISSPTFSLVNEYQTRSGRVIYHFDFYRIESIIEVFDMGFEEYLYSGNLCLIEWPEKVQELLPEDVIRIRIDQSEGIRTYKVMS